MLKRFHALEIDVYVPGRWYLSEPTSFGGQEIDDIWQFIDGKPLQLSERFRTKHYTAHRRLGRVLVTAVMVSVLLALIFGARDRRAAASFLRVWPKRFGPPSSGASRRCCFSIAAAMRH